MSLRPRLPARPLLGLTVAVLAVHGWLLRATPERLRAPERSATGPSFIVRSIPANPPTAAAAAAATKPAVAPLQFLPAALAAAPSIPAANAMSAARATHPAAPVVALAVLTTAQPAPAPASAEPRSQAAQAPALAVPGSMRLHYQVAARVRERTLHAEGELLWRHDAESYEAQLEVSAPLLPTRRQRSIGRITAEGLAPLRFSDKARGSEEAAHFERDKGKISFSNNQPDAPLAAGAQDRLSVMLQLGALIAAQPRRFPPAATVAIQTASVREAELWLFTVEGEEELQLPGGTVSALKLSRNPRREFDQKIELWLAPAMDYVPVRLRLTQPNGDSVDQQWASTDRN